MGVTCRAKIKRLFADLYLLPLAFHKYDCHKGEGGDGAGGYIRCHQHSHSGPWEISRTLAILGSCGKLDCWHRFDTSKHNSDIWVKFLRAYRAWIWCHIFCIFEHLFWQLIGSLCQKLQPFLKIYQPQMVYMLLFGPYQPFIYAQKYKKYDTKSMLCTPWEISPIYLIITLFPPPSEVFLLQTHRSYCFHMFPLKVNHIHNSSSQVYCFETNRFGRTNHVSQKKLYVKILSLLPSQTKPNFFFGNFQACAEGISHKKS